MFRKTLLLLFLIALVLAQDGAEADDTALDEAEDDFGDEEDEGFGDDEEVAEGDEEEEVEEGEEAEAAVVEEEAEPVAAVVVEEPKTAEQILAEQKEEEDLWILLIGITSCVDLVWWFVWGMFVYIETNSADSTMCINSDCTVKVVPVAWFWEAVNPLNTTMGYTALGYLFVFLFYMLISIPEFAFWIMYMVKQDPGAMLLNIWATYVGLYGSWILYLLPIIMYAVQLSTVTNISNPGFINACVHIAMLVISWLFTGIIHVLGYPYVNRMYERDYENKAAEPKEEVPPAEPVEPTPEEEDEEEVDEEPTEEEEPVDEGEEETDEAW